MAGASPVAITMAPTSTSRSAADASSRTAPNGQAAAQAAHAAAGVPGGAVWRRQASRSSTATCGRHPGYGRWMALRAASPPASGSSASAGQAATHSGQPRQASGSTPRGRSAISTANRPAVPRTRRSSAPVRISTPAWWSAASTTGSMKQLAHSSPGEIRSSWLASPPSTNERSTSTTLRSSRARASAADSPAAPPPTTSTSAETSTSPRGRLRCSATRARPAATRRRARAVAAAGSPPAHSTCSRRFTSWTSQGERPSRARTPRKVSSCSRGEQAPITTRSSPRARIRSASHAWPSAEQSTSWTATSAAPGQAAADSSGRRTTAPRFGPQRQK